MLSPVMTRITPFSSSEPSTLGGRDGTGAAPQTSGRDGTRRGASFFTMCFALLIGVWERRHSEPCCLSTGRYPQMARKPSSFDSGRRARGDEQLAADASHSAGEAASRLVWGSGSTPEAVSP